MQKNCTMGLFSAFALASQHGWYGYRRIAIKLQEMGWNVSKGRVERICQRVLRRNERLHLDFIEEGIQQSPKDDCRWFPVTLHGLRAGVPIAVIRTRP